MTDTERWPSIPVADRQDTRDTLHPYAQVVGKVRLANDPVVNHRDGECDQLLGLGVERSVAEDRGVERMNGGPGSVHAPRAFEAFREFNK